jgi:N-acetylneuraminic acid mutarotase
MKKSTSQSAFSSPRTLSALLLFAGTACCVLTGASLAFFRPEAPAKVSNRTVTFAERVAYQRAIEEVYWRHRIWPEERPDPKPSLDAVLPQAQLEKRVADYLRKSQALEDYWQRPITGEQLQAEMDRMAQHTKQPEVLHELFEALGNDPFLIAECLARPALAERLLTKWYTYDQTLHEKLKLSKNNDHLKLATVSWLKEPLESWLATAETQVRNTIAAPMRNYRLPQTSQRVGGCIDDTWTATAGPPDGRDNHTAIWTGTEMIIWGGGAFGMNTGGRYNPSTDTWIATSTTNAPSARYSHTAVWTGTEMIVWGGGYPGKNTGGRYNPDTDSWTATSITNAPTPRTSHSAVWTGTEMIVWGGWDSNNTFFDTGGRYNPNTDTWTSTSTTNAPTGRYYFSVAWTGSEMIVWGGGNNDTPVDTGGRYNLGTNSWVATSTTNAPAARFIHTAVWTGTNMIVWGGYDFLNTYFDTGGKYDPDTDTWVGTSTDSVPLARGGHTAVWTGSEMIIWGGVHTNLLNTGGRYNPDTDSWTATNTSNAPDSREAHTAVWTGSEMIVWGGYRYPAGIVNTGGRYNPSTDNWINTGNNNAPDSREYHSAVWTGSEMIVWGGAGCISDCSLNTGGRYIPGIDSWTATSTANAPSARFSHTAVWTGVEMVVWGGGGSNGNTLNSGGRYNPGMNSWTPTSTTNAPDARYIHTAVWTGSEIIVWGGLGSIVQLDTGERHNPSSAFGQTPTPTPTPLPALNNGARYNPGTDSWIATSTTDAPTGREGHTAVWTDNEMIIWGGGDSSGLVSTGGRYDPRSDSWTPTNTTNAPVPRTNHAGVWSGTEMIVWGGRGSIGNSFNSGGRYDPGSDSWTPTNTTNAPEVRYSHTAVWTADEMIIWGGVTPGDLNDGGRYNPSTDAWMFTTTTNAPDHRSSHSAVWTGTEMIVWGGTIDNNSVASTGGRYCAQSGPTPTPTPTPTVTPTPGQIVLTASGRRVQGRHTVDLSWSGANSADIDIYRAGVVIATVPNTGAYKDFIGVRGGNVRYIYKVCEAGTQTCSNEVTVRFGGPPL